MISRVLCIGNKIELTKSISAASIEEIQEKRVFMSQLLDIMEDEKMKISMPMEQGKIIPIPVNARMDACFYTPKGLYQCKIVITDRYKEGQIFILVVEMASPLKKYQRRQYFRLGCIIDIKYRTISKQELEEYTHRNDLIKERCFMEGTALDISGGGIRFVSERKLEKDQEILISLDISYGKQSKSYGLLGRVIMSYEAKSKVGLYEHRIEFINMQGGVRESLIKYIFEEERRQRQLEM